MDTADAPLEWASAGMHVASRLADRYKLITTAVGTIRHRGVDAPPADTVEGILYGVPLDRYLVDARRLGALLDGASTTARVSPWFGYSPLDPANVASNDALVFVRDVAAS
jgi:hypothetical protein